MRALNCSSILVAMFAALASPCMAEEEPPVPPVQKGDQVITHIVGVKDMVGTFNYIRPTTPAVHVKTVPDNKHDLVANSGEMLDSSYSSETAWKEAEDSKVENRWRAGSIPGKRVNALVQGKFTTKGDGGQGQGGGQGEGGGGDESVWTTMSVDLDLDADTNRDGPDNLSDPKIDVVEDKDEDQSGHGTLVAVGGRAPLLLRQVLPDRPIPRPVGEVTIKRSIHSAVDIVYKGTDTSIFTKPKDKVSQNLWDKVKDGECELELVGLHDGFDEATLETEYKSGTTSFKDKVLAAVILDLDIDSDNNNGFNTPDRSLEEDEIEDVANDVTKPGKVILANVKDVDGDGIPDFADGFNWDQGMPSADSSDDRTRGEKFATMVIHVWGGTIDMKKARFRFTYSASDPANVTRAGPATHFRYTPAPGNLRIWKKDGSESRNKARITAGGDYVAPGVAYSADELGLSSWWFGSTYKSALYVEGIAPSTSVADQRILLEVDANGDGRFYAASDATRTTVALVAFSEDPNGNVYGYDDYGWREREDKKNPGSSLWITPGPSNDFVSAEKSKTTKVRASVKGVHLSFVTFSSSNDRVFSIDKQHLVATDDVLEIRAQARNKAEAYLEARNPAGDVLARLGVCVYAKVTDQYQLFNVVDDSAPSKARNTALSHPNLSSQGNRGMEAIANSRLKQAVVDANIIGGGAITPSAYDLNDNGRLDLAAPGYPSTEEEKQVRLDCRPLNGRIAIVYVKDVEWNYFLTSDARAGTHRIALRSTRFLTEGHMYVLEQHTPAGWVSEIVTIKSIGWFGRVTLAANLTNTYTVANNASLLFGLAGVSGNPITVEDDPNQDVICHTASHEIGHTSCGLLDLAAWRHMMCFTIGHDGDAIRRRGLPKYYETGDEEQWDVIQRP